jgi:putative ABC transport system ATP-binding protein
MIMLENRIVQINNVYKSFPLGDQDIMILNGISLNIKAGEFVSIVGPSGNGKSTLLNMITGIDHPNSGEVIINGLAIHDLDEDRLSAWRATSLGIVFQFFQLLPALNILQNVILPMDFAGNFSRQQRYQRAKELLETVGLTDQMYKLPSRLSGGQQQRAAIARALANDPPLIVADEPTGNLDARTSEDIFQLFSHLIDQGKTLIMVTHNEQLACRAMRRIEILNGSIVSDSPCDL